VDLYAASAHFQACAESTFSRHFGTSDCKIKEMLSGLGFHVTGEKMPHTFQYFSWTAVRY